MERLLYISHRLPYPPDKGERVRAFHEIKTLAEHCRVTLAGLLHGEAESQHVKPLREICHEVITAPAGGKRGLARGAVSLLTGRSVTEGYFHNRRLMRQLVALGRDNPFDVVLGYCSSTLPYVEAVAADRRMLDLVDVDSLKWASYAASCRGPKRWLYKAEAQRVAALEARAVETCDAVLLVSQAEIDAFHARAPNVRAVANGVDTEYFRPDATEPAYLGPRATVFTGTMDYAPNIEGVCWFVRHVWPAVMETCPQATFTIVGRNPTPAVRALGEAAGVTVTGAVPDVRPYLAGAKLAVCPLLTARGIQNKILEALAMSTPVIATPDAAEGLDTHAEGLGVVEGSEAWSRAVVEGLTKDAGDPVDGSGPARAALSWTRRLEPLVELVLGERPTRSALGEAEVSR